MFQAQGLTDFLLRILRFHPEQRATAGELLSDPWLQGTLPAPSSNLVELSLAKRGRTGPVAAPGAAGSGATLPTHSDNPFHGPPPPPRAHSAQPCLSGGDDAARAGAARGYSALFCADLCRYAITLTDFEALEARDLAAAAAELSAASYEDLSYDCPMEHVRISFALLSLAALLLDLKVAMIRH
jgi:hypothetical protein